MSAEARLKELGIELPPPAAPAGLYAPCVQVGPLVFVSGQIPMQDGKPIRHGKCGESVSLDEGAALARQCAIQGLAVVREQVGSLDNVRRVVRVGGFVASGKDFIEHPRVINGASQLLIDVFGEEAGRHARIAVGLAELPLGVPVEVEFLFEINRAAAGG
ncbi:MAG: RidA family protein [Dehalococcoidia bacterium]